ncbi:MAG: hypothetical protein KJ985_06085, partial [Proteobacteria bacterium]|nr:hypothetical protein [Pseudomonadota bacterium]
MPHRNGSRWLWRPVYCSRIPLAVCQSGLEEHSFSRRDIVPRQEGDRHGPDEPEPPSSARPSTPMEGTLLAVIGMMQVERLQPVPLGI